MLEIDLPEGTDVVVTNFNESEVVVDYGKYKLEVKSKRQDAEYGVVLSCKLVEA